MVIDMLLTYLSFFAVDEPIISPAFGHEDVAGNNPQALRVLTPSCLRIIVGFGEFDKT